MLNILVILQILEAINIITGVIMNTSKATIIAQLQKEIWPLQGYKPGCKHPVPDIGLGPIIYAFPNAEFPLAAVHEFIASMPEEAAATGGFVAGVLAALMRKGGATVWLSANRTIFPPALVSFGIAPDKIIFVDLKKEKEILWAMEEALKCDGLAAVVGELSELSFMASRRLQLAVEKSRVTGFVLRQNFRSLNTNACVTRWKITPLASHLADGMPGVGFPRWKVELLKVRNGKPGNWQVEWTAGKFRHLAALSLIIPEQHKKTG